MGSNIIFFGLIAFLFLLEWDHLRKRDGKANANIAIGLAVVLIAITLTVNYFFGLIGMMVMLLVLAGIAPIQLYVRMKKYGKR